MKQRFGKVAVLFGGSSAERDVSLMSGAAVLAALQGAGVDAHAFDPAERDLHILKEEGYDRVFIALHGRGGEDGTVQGALELMGIPYTGSGVMASALAMDKWRTKMVWLSCGLPTPRYAILDADSDFDAIARDLGLPIFVKPVHEGSSMGATKVTEAGQLRAAWELAARYDSLVIAEEFISGQELTAPFLDDRALPLVRIVAPDGNYDYQHKYFTDDTRYDCPCGLPQAEEEALQALILKSARVLGCRGWGRADLILTPEGRPYLLEMNTSPGMTGHSLVPMSARVAGMSFEALCLAILAGARLG
ncbi:D-alanine--D-alanine ligase [Azoarcus olearius]|uniref:D-alanine--D-alanine ligase n=1 Tax=Azoarcus sp. (strain BH72) TaxID=418699 RepID=DDL_AZOSB|nr:D-alanine--D-alanine ligase [Azoarcus olearius]A1K3U8.1 RecName: Full=D-alanine--D-alanine ligase; AltName: Full=D-Ala-D-Ala ligase; AltName: Full=D-alanylalanine synthetase [Azoarcus olearius]ANQ84025.1 D-alanine--D-alanine ligase [Azoarcus olearius]CAL93503.1 probable D-alanine-D-alanine ligase [Azoarcus olearius]